MTRRYVNQLINGDSVDESFLVADKQLRANRQGNLYLHLELRDKTGSAGARLWNASEGLGRAVGRGTRGRGWRGRSSPGTISTSGGRRRSSRGRSRSSSRTSR